MTATVRQCTGADHPHGAERSPSLKLGYSDTPLINHYGDTRLDSPKHANVASRSIKDESDSAPINQNHLIDCIALGCLLSQWVGDAGFARAHRAPNTLQNSCRSFRSASGDVERRLSP